MERNKALKKSKLVLGVLFFLAAAILMSACDRIGKAYKDDIYVLSPDGKYRLIIQEWGTIGGAGAEIYIENRKALIPSLTRKHIGNATSDDCEFPFEDGDYYVQWESERVLIFYYGATGAEDYSDPETWRCVEYRF